MALTHFLLNLIFPPKCPFCNSPTDQDPLLPCPKCRKADFWLEGEQAVVAGEHFLRCACAGWYQGELRTSMRRFKFHNHPDYAKAYGPVLAKAIRFYLPGSYDLITWVPVSPATLQDRGYDQARLLAEETAKALSAQALPLLAAQEKPRPQSSLNQTLQRRRNAAGIYSVPDPAAVAGQRVLLIDDIITTGATLEDAARALRQAGATQVVSAAFCRAPERG